MKAKTTKTLYLAYGSNLNQAQMAVRCPGAKMFCTTKLKNYRLRFRGGTYHAVATVEREKGCSVPAIIWEITESDEEALDRYEGYPRLYRKEYQYMTINGTRYRIMFYVMDLDYTYGIPSPSYYRSIFTGYQEAKLDLNALREAVLYTYEQSQEDLSGKHNASLTRMLEKAPYFQTAERALDHHRLSRSTTHTKED